MAESSCNNSNPLKGLTQHYNADDGNHREMRLQAPPNTAQVSFRTEHSNNEAENSYAALMNITNNTFVANQHVLTSHLEFPGSFVSPTSLAIRQHALSTSVMTSTNIDPQRLQRLEVDDSPPPTNPQPFVSPAAAALTYRQRPHKHITPQMTPTVAFQQNFDAWVVRNNLMNNSNPGTGEAIIQPDFSEVDVIMDKLAEELAQGVSIEPGQQGVPENSMRNDTDATLPTMDSAPNLDHELVIDRNQDSEISEVARQILLSVERENDDKWKKSTFLALMRDLRDGKKEIREDTIRDNVTITEGA